MSAVVKLTSNGKVVVDPKGNASEGAPSKSPTTVTSYKATVPFGSSVMALKAAVAGSAPMSNYGALTNFTKPPLVNSGKRALSWSYSQLVKVTVVKIATNARENILFIFFIIKVFN
jgi:hypothetical protein